MDSTCGNAEGCRSLQANAVCVKTGPQEGHCIQGCVRVCPRALAPPYSIGRATCTFIPWGTRHSTRMSLHLYTSSVCLISGSPGPPWVHSANNTNYFSQRPLSRGFCFCRGPEGPGRRPAEGDPSRMWLLPPTVTARPGQLSEHAQRPLPLPFINSRLHVRAVLLPPHPTVASSLRVVLHRIAPFPV